MKKNPIIITLITNEPCNMVAVITSNNELSIESMEMIKNMNLILPFYIDEFGKTKANDVMLDDIMLEKITYNDDMSSCKIYVNN